ncbi:MAG: SMC-Scp complex subunit ScpB [Clostridia bacterium]|nr:SMC-Scp complex subunit ScpB [Clostridia bacterium]
MPTITNVEAAIEAILFAAGYPVKYEKLSEVLGLTQKEIKLLVENMAASINAENSPRGLNLLTFDDSCQLCTKERFAPYIREALGIRRGGNLSASSLEVLAIVAYNQPATRAFVDAVRGVDSSYAVSSLVDKGLIEGVGRLDAPGRPVLYGTTEKFLRVFGINSLDDLPETEPLAPPAAQQLQMDVKPAENTSADSSEVPPSEDSAEVSGGEN